MNKKLLRRSRDLVIFFFDEYDKHGEQSAWEKLRIEMKDDRKKVQSMTENMIKNRLG